MSSCPTCCINNEIDTLPSDWVKEEANIGKERKILVPAKIDPVDLPLGFGRIQAADLTNWQAEKGHPGFSSLQNAISELAGPPSESETPQADNSSGSFWRVKLPKPATIEKIVIWNRSDCCANRLSNFRVSVLSVRDDSKAPVWCKDREEAVKQGGFEEFKPAPPAKGQYVEVKFHKDFNFEKTVISL